MDGGVEIQGGDRKLDFFQPRENEPFLGLNRQNRRFFITDFPRPSIWCRAPDGGQKNCAIRAGLRMGAPGLGEDWAISRAPNPNGVETATIFSIFQVLRYQFSCCRA